MDVVTLLDLIQQGYYATYPLLLCSIVALAIAGERLWAFPGLTLWMMGVPRQIGSARRGDRWRDNYVQREASDPPSDLPAALPRRRRADRRSAGARTDINGAGAALRRNVWLLGTIGSAAPFIGLFGTVVGIMRAFHSMALAGTGGFAVVASGISEALVATALGLAVAIIAVVLYNYFQVRLAELATTMRVGVTRFIDGVCAFRGEHGRRQVA
jgi:biopolymer transport protein ExbB